MKLYYTPGSSATSVHMALRHLGLPFEIERVDLATKTTETGKNYLDINSFGYVPALELDSGKTLFETVAIMQYLFELSPDGKTLGAEDRAMYLEWFAHIGTELHAAMSFAWSVRDKTECRNAILAKAARRLGPTEAYLSGDRKYVSFEDPKQVGLLDFYLFGVLFGLSYLEFDLSPFPNIQAFMERMKQQPAVIETMKAEGLV
ncbi:MAG TPA: glutathione S-transferase N-terminal domain-containing protein [bacterium]|nr:glutathione S-transferase N-terminal domain-containing protein [bacterium]